MRSSSVLALGTLAVGQAAAAGHRHASFHARRNGNTGLAEVDAVQLARDLKDLDWKTINIDWASVLATVNFAPTPTPEVQVKVASAVVTPSPTPTPSSTEAAKPSETAKSNPISNIVEGLFEGLSQVMSKLDIKAQPKNSVTPNGALWLGDAGTAPLRVKHINKSGQDMTLFCWVSNSGYTGFTINVNAAAVGVKLPKDGSAVVTSHGNKVPFGCSPVVNGIGLPFGGVNNTWFEGEQHIADNGQLYGTFDISKNPNMNGTPISSQGSKCTSNMKTCVFECNSGDSCVTGYTLKDCGPHNGGHKGFDQKEQGDGGGCSMSSQESITVHYG